VAQGKHHRAKAIPGSSQVANSAGGFSWQVDDWDKLTRFLVLGTEGGTYYTREQVLTEQSAEAVRRCIKTDGARTVAEIVAISEGGRAPKNEPAIFALAMALSFGNAATKQVARLAIPKVCRIGTAPVPLRYLQPADARLGKGFEVWDRRLVLC